MAKDNEEQVIGIKKGRGCLTKGMVVALLLVCSAGVFCLWWSGSINHRAKDLLAAARTEAAALQADLPEVKPEDNALLPFKTAFGKYSKPADSSLECESKDAGRDFSSEAVKKFLKSNSECLADLEKALLLPSCDYGDDYSLGLQGQKLPSLSENRKTARLLVIAARHEALEARTATALEKLALVLRVADPISAQPGLIPRMIRCAIETKFADGAAGVLNTSEPSADSLEKLLKKLSDHAGARGDMSESFRVEKALLSVTVARALAGETVLYDSFSMRDGMTWKVWWWRNSGNFVADMDMMRDSQAKAVKAVSQPYPQALTAIRAHVKATGKAPDWALMSGMAMAKPDRSTETDCEALARLELARVLIGLRLHRLARGAYPDGLDEVKGIPKPAPCDPFTGKPFGYLKTAGGCRLWSAGRNCRDDGGKHAPDPKYDGKLDLVVELAK